MQIKTKLTALFLLIITSLCAQTTINLGSLQGNDKGYAIENIGKLTFIPDTVIVNKKDGITEKFGITQMRRIVFLKEVYSEQETFLVDQFDGIHLYPNPVIDVLYLGLELEREDHCIAEIYNLKGQKVKSIIKQASCTVVRLNVEHLPRGIYLCRIKTGERIITKKFIKQ